LLIITGVELFRSLKIAIVGIFITSFGIAAQAEEKIDRVKASPKQLFSSAHFIDFAIHDICLAAMDNEVSVTEWFKTGATPGGMGPGKLGPIEKQIGYTKAWRASGAKSHILDGPGKRCTVISQTIKTDKRHKEVVTKFSKDPKRFQRLYSGQNAAKTGKRDIYCVTLSPERFAILTMTVRNKGGLRNFKDNFLLTVSASDKPCDTPTE